MSVFCFPFLCFVLKHEMDVHMRFDFVLLGLVNFKDSDIKKGGLRMIMNS